MTTDEWRKDPALANQLKEILSSPVLSSALGIIKEQTMASTISISPQTATNAHVLFGWDAGKASVFRDLESLATIPQEIEELHPTYTGEF